MIIELILDIWKYFRLNLGFLISAPYLFPLIVNYKDLKRFKPKVYLEGYIVTFLLVTIGNLLNDYLDYDIDKNSLRKQSKPLMKYNINKNLNLIISVILCLLVLFIILKQFSILHIIGMILGFAISIGYYFLKYHCPFDLIFNSILSVCPMIAGWYLVNYKFPPSWVIFSNIVFLSIIFIHADIWDMKEDEISTVKVLGIKKSLVFLVVLVLLLFIILPENMCMIRIALVLWQFGFVYSRSTNNWKLYKLLMMLLSVIFYLDSMLELWRMDN